MSAILVYINCRTNRYSRYERNGGPPLRTQSARPLTPEEVELFRVDPASLIDTGAA